MNRSITPHIRVLAATAVAGLALLPAACSSGSSAASDDATTPSEAEATALTVEDPWAKAVDDGMTAVFGTVTNTSDEGLLLTSAESDAAASAELHVFVDNDGESVMQEADGGLTIPANGDVVLEPGGPHVMLMGVSDPLEPGEDVTVTLTAEDGSDLEITAPARSFAGADESYDPAGGKDGEGMDHSVHEHGESMDHDHDHDHGEGDGQSMDHSGGGDADHREDM